MIGHPHNGRPFSNPYDLLGLFLSSLGPAPIGATRANFYLPLTAVYGRWCAQIAGSPLGGVGYVPAMFQCTWRVKDGTPPQFFLGSSIAGYTERGTGTWPRVVRLGRFNLIFPDGDFDKSPSILLYGDAGSRFGSCAETHPFLELMKCVFLTVLFIPLCCCIFSLIRASPIYCTRGPTLEQGVCHGLALKSNYFIARDYGKSMTLAQLQGSLMSPCSNCRELIASFCGDIRNFYP